MVVMLSFFIAILGNYGVRVIIKISFIFVFFESYVLRDEAFRTRVSIVTASCFIISFGNVRISLHKIL